MQRINSSPLLFQFLIGSLKTGNLFNTIIVYIWVSIPHRQSKNLLNRICSRSVRHCEVSIPHRQSKNLNCLDHQCHPIHVSIPHRQSKNNGYGDIVKETVNRFQFLIGSLKTLLEWLGISRTPKFQFLIGSLKT